MSAMITLCVWGGGGARLLSQWLLFVFQGKVMKFVSHRVLITLRLNFTSSDSWFDVVKSICLILKNFLAIVYWHWTYDQTSERVLFWGCLSRVGIVEGNFLQYREWRESVFWRLSWRGSTLPPSFRFSCGLHLVVLYLFLMSSLVHSDVSLLL